MFVHAFSGIIFRRLRATRFSLLIAALTIIGLTVSAWALLSTRIQASPSAPTVKAESVVPVPRQGSSKRESVEAEVITILPTGFNPSTITRPHGRFLILIDNRSGSNEIALKLDRVAGHRLRAVRLTKEELILRQIEDLPPGEYLLTEADHPDWVCRVTITPH